MECLPNYTMVIGHKILVLSLFEYISSFLCHITGVHVCVCMVGVVCFGKIYSFCVYDSNHLLRYVWSVCVCDNINDGLVTWLEENKK